MQAFKTLSTTNSNSPAAFIHLFLLIPLFALALLIIIQLSSPPVQASVIEAEKKFDYQGFLVTEVEGISLRTPPEMIPVILEKNSYSQARQATYTKQTQEPGQRKSVYRIEIEDTATHRQITYFRGKTGGRIKSSAQAEPIPADEFTIARAVYKLVCGEVSSQTQAARSCLPVTESNIRFGDGNLLEISDNVVVQLSASATSTTITLRYTKD
ncbi:hypothetical protein SAMN05216419_103324 [Nitrosomonas cryotolerans]|uniref:Uncharacterized protein n=1 Tax=Nitrosomonas cryotolerans ATCC 49181 TaxID=1131553 RepID=A0A1N6FWK4_9PROT|nr:hypothetical protein [Nitrosomonas cryotolerans]SFP92244.1 hypothetical protein SAMN05216419_103324 [Nitrosomonas cryotolerans]SIN99591.1 hypothetical protein SAMN02743940_0434 [Nitrosomonas cryotolerans ATCC 49181]